MTRSKEEKLWLRYVQNGALLHPYVFEDKLDSFWSSSVILMNPQSRGSVKLQSSNPADPPLFDMAYMTHPYDRHILIEGVRRAMQFVKTNALSPFWKSTIIAPKSEQDEDIWVSLPSYTTQPNGPH